MVYNAPMYIEIVPNRNSPPAVLLREGWREGSKTLKRTLANLSHWPQQKIEAFRRLLQDEPLVSPQDLFCTRKTLPHGHVEAILMAMRQLGLDSLLAAKRCRERDLVYRFTKTYPYNLVSCYAGPWHEHPNVRGSFLPMRRRTALISFANPRPLLSAMSNARRSCGAITPARPSARSHEP